MYRLAVTLLDSFRLWRDLPEDAEWFPVEELEARIKGAPFEETEEMRIGKALHAIVEGKGAKDGSMLESGGILFDSYSVQPILDAFRGGVHEVKATMEIATPHGPVLLVGKADYLYGTDAYELKSRMGRAHEPERYQDSVQWKAYTLLFGVRRVIYHFAQLSDCGGVLHVVNHDTLPLFPYPAIRADVLRLVNDFTDFCAARDLLPYLIRESHEQAKEAA